MHPTIICDAHGRYTIPTPLSGDEIIGLAYDIVAEAFCRPRKMRNADDTKTFLTLEFAKEEREVFGVLFLDTQHGLISFERMFTGTIDSAVVHPREVVKRALQVNAAAVIVTHNHPSGDPEPSRADIAITQRLLSALTVVDVRLLDHIVVGGTRAISFADRGLI